MEKITHAHGPWPFKFHTSLYTSGLVFLGTERGGTKSGDHLICIYNDDSLLVQNVPQELSSAHSRSLGIIRPFRRKCEIVCSPCNSGGYGDQVQGMGNILQGIGNIHDIKECSPDLHDIVAAVMLSTYTVSALSSGKITWSCNNFRCHFYCRTTFLRQ